ncbi:hypothetical protein [Paraburkholderia sediminicola]|uniref:hypothetical protein n=1 Tax=Paraburkholderia sediminicola TaxID=458836 RepID=UPI0038BB46DD
MNGIPLGVNQSVMLRYRFESAWLARCGFNDDDRKSLGSQKSILNLLFLIVITLGYRTRPGLGLPPPGAARQWVFGSMAGVFLPVYHRFQAVNPA